jgi:pimeloyl-ACP methyl ester carboxylesterase
MKAGSDVFAMRHSVARVEGTSLHWAELSRGDDAPPVVMLHGLNDSYLTWSGVARSLARGRRVFLLDLPGHGLSERPDASYELGWYAHVFARWLEAVGLDHVDVVGHSFGGGVALTALLECRERIRRLVLASSGGLGRDIAIVLRLASIPYVVEHFGQPFMAPGTWLALRAARDVFSDEHIAELRAMNAKRGSARAFARTVHDIIDWRGQRQTFFQRAHELATLPPMAVCWGDRDGIIPLSHAKALAEYVDGIVLTTFAGCGHYVHHEQPDAFAQTVRDFLDAPAVPAARLRARRPPPSPPPQKRSSLARMMDRARASIRVRHRSNVCDASGSLARAVLPR